MDRISYAVSILYRCIITTTLYEQGISYCFTSIYLSRYHRGRQRGRRSSQQGGRNHFNNQGHHGRGKEDVNNKEMSKNQTQNSEVAESKDSEGHNRLQNGSDPLSFVLANSHDEEESGKSHAEWNLCLILIYLITSTIWCRTHNRAGLQFMFVLTDNPPSPGKVDHTTRVYVPYSFQTVV